MENETDLEIYTRAIGMYFKQYTSEQLKTCITNTITKLNLPIETVGNELRGKYPSIHLFIEEIDSRYQLYYKLSYSLYIFLENKDWRIINFLGEGAESDVFLVHNTASNRKRALCLISNVQKSDIPADVKKEWYNNKVIYDLRNYQKHDDTPIANTYVKIYDILRYDEPYSKDEEYIKYSEPDFVDRPILVLEVAPYTVESYVKTIKGKHLSVFKTLFPQKFNDLINIVSSGYYTYTDIKGSNIGLFPNDSNTDFDLKFIDIRTFRESSMYDSYKWYNSTKIQNGEIPPWVYE